MNGRQKTKTATCAYTVTLNFPGPALPPKRVPILAMDVLGLRRRICKRRAWVAPLDAVLTA